MVNSVFSHYTSHTTINLLTTHFSDIYHTPVKEGLLSHKPTARNVAYSDWCETKTRSSYSDVGRGRLVLVNWDAYIMVPIPLSHGTSAASPSEPLILLLGSIFENIPLHVVWSCIAPSFPSLLFVYRMLVVICMNTPSCHLVGTKCSDTHLHRFCLCTTCL